MCAHALRSAYPSSGEFLKTKPGPVAAASTNLTEAAAAVASGGGHSVVDGRCTHRIFYLVINGCVSVQSRQAHTEQANMLHSVGLIM